MAEKTQKFDSKTEAEQLAKAAFRQAKSTWKNVDGAFDPTLEEKPGEFVLTRPDIHEGIVFVHFVFAS